MTSSTLPKYRLRASCGGARASVRLLLVAVLTFSSITGVFRPTDAHADARTGATRWAYGGGTVVAIIGGSAAYFLDPSITLPTVITGFVGGAVAAGSLRLAGSGLAYLGRKLLAQINAIRDDGSAQYTPIDDLDLFDLSSIMGNEKHERAELINALPFTLASDDDAGLWVPLKVISAKPTQDHTHPPTNKDVTGVDHPGSFDVTFNTSYYDPQKRFFDHSKQAEHTIMKVAGNDLAAIRENIEQVRRLTRSIDYCTALHREKAAKIRDRW